MGFTLVGIMNLAFATNLYWLLASVFIVGIGSSVLHPEASRITFLASGGKRGLAQSLFQVGGNLGGSLGPLLVALLVAPYGRHHIALFMVFALIAIVVMIPICRWFRSYLNHIKKRPMLVAGRRTPSFLKDDGVCHKYSADTYLLQIYLYGKFDELLYILSDP